MIHRLRYKTLSMIFYINAPVLASYFFRFMLKSTLLFSVHTEKIKNLYKNHRFEVSDLDYNKQRKEIKRKLYVSHKNGLKEIFQNF